MVPDDPLESVLDKLPDPVVLLDAAQRITLANRCAVDLFGADPVGRHLLTFVRQPAVLEAVGAVLGGQAQAQARHVAQGAVTVVHKVSVQRHGAGAVLSFADVTAIERADEMHADFVANVSHELRSPLTALSGFIETLQGPAAGDPAARQEFLAIMQTEAERMRRLIDDLLHLSRVEVNERVRPTDRVDILGLLRDVRNGLGPVAAQNKVELEIKNDAQDTVITADHDQITQVFQNLIENAIKYCPAAPVHIHLGEVERFIGVPGAALRVDIIDRGPGIAPLHLPRLTERFYRVDGHRARGLGGTGLGLAIVKHITNRHRGRLLIASEPGKGSVFSVILPRV